MSECVPSTRCSMTLRQTSSCCANFFSEFAWLQSTISTGGNFSDNQFFLRRADAFGVVIRLRPPAAQHNVRVRVAGGADDARHAVLVDAQKTVRMPRRAHRVNRHLQTAVRGIFQADGHGKAAGHFAMRLRFRRARADGRPGNQVGDVLRHNRVEKFRRRRQDPGRRFPAAVSARFSDPVSMSCEPSRCGIVDQALPANGRARFFKINAHDDFHAVGEFLAQGVQSLSVFQRGFLVMDGARPDDDEEARVFLSQNADDPSRGCGRRWRPRPRSTATHLSVRAARAAGQFL